MGTAVLEMKVLVFLETAPLQESDDLEIVEGLLLLQAADIHAHQ